MHQPPVITDYQQDANQDDFEVHHEEATEEERNDIYRMLEEMTDLIRGEYQVQTPGEEEEEKKGSSNNSDDEDSDDDFGEDRDTNWEGAA